MPSVVKSYIGSTSGSVGAFAGAPEIPEGPPTWSDIPDQDTNFKDLPQSLDLKQYVRANPPITSWDDDLGIVDEDGIATMPEGAPIAAISVNVTATNDLGSTPTEFTWHVTAEDSPDPTLYVNPQLAGGTAGTPGTAPTDHNFAFNGGSVDYEISRNNEYFIMETVADNARQVCQYLIASRNPDLTVGNTYIIGVRCKNVGPEGSGTRAIALSNQTNVTLLRDDFNVPLGEEKNVWFMFSVDDVGWSANFRMGTGTTTNRSERFQFYRPILVEVGDTTPTWDTVPDQTTHIDDLPDSLDMNQFVDNPIPIATWFTTFGQIDVNGILTIPAGTGVGDYEIQVTCINPLAQATSAPFTWSVVEDIDDPVIEQHPQDRTVTVPDGTTFTVVASHPEGELFYEWEASRDGITWLPPNQLASDVVVSTITAETLVLNSTTLDSDFPNIFVHPFNRTIVEPNEVRFFCGANHPLGAELFYEWEASDDGGQTWQSPELLASDVNIESITTNTLFLESTEL